MSVYCMKQERTEQGTTGDMQSLSGRANGLALPPVERV